MREILFRGKRTDNDEWVYGSFCMAALEQFNGLCGVDGFIRLYDKAKGKTQTYEVDRETVGQFTGLTDKNGKKVFEGDIVEGRCHSAWNHDVQRCEIAYGRDGFEARHHVQCGDEARYYKYKVLFSKSVVVIGNIHDNPELLDGAE